MEEILEEFDEQRDEDPGHWILDPCADPLWLPLAGTNTGKSLVIDHRPGDTYGNIIEIDYEGGEVTAVRWKNLGEMIRLTAESLESGCPMPYSRVPQLDEGPPGRLNWKLEEIQDQDARSPLPRTGGKGLLLCTCYGLTGPGTSMKYASLSSIRRLVQKPERRGPARSFWAPAMVARTHFSVEVGAVFGGRGQRAAGRRTHHRVRPRADGRVRREPAMSTPGDEW